MIVLIAVFDVLADSMAFSASLSLNRSEVRLFNSSLFSETSLTASSISGSTQE